MQHSNDDPSSRGVRKTSSLAARLVLLGVALVMLTGAAGLTFSQLTRPLSREEEAERAVLIADAITRVPQTRLAQAITHLAEAHHVDLTVVTRSGAVQATFRRCG